MRNYINTGATDPSRARTVGLTQLTPEPFPVLTVGTKPTHQFFFADRGTVESWSGAADHSLRVTLADVMSAPAGSDFTIGVNSNTLTIPFDVDKVGLESALNNDASITADGGIDVYQQAPGRFALAYRQAGIPNYALSANATQLFPDCATDLVTITEGDANTRQLMFLNVRRNYPVQSAAWNVITSPSNGWQGAIDLTSAASLELMRLKGQQRGEYVECQSLLTVEARDGSGQADYTYQTPVLLRALNYMVTSTLTVGPTRNAQTSNAAGNVTVTPASQIHTERIEFTSNGTRNVIVSPTGLSAGARVDIVAMMANAANGLTINVYSNVASGTPLFAFTRNDGEETALFSIFADGSGSFNQKLATIPAFDV